MSEKNRLAVLALLENGPMDTSALIKNLPIAYATLIHHLDLLCKAGLVKPAKNGAAGAIC